MMAQWHISPLPDTRPQASDNDNNGIEMIELDADTNEETSNQGFDDSQNFLNM